MSDEEVYCSYCGKPLWGSHGELHVTSLKGTRVDFDKVVDTNIENETFCDARCLCDAIMEMAWIRDSEIEYSRKVDSHP